MLGGTVFNVRGNFMLQSARFPNLCQPLNWPEKNLYILAVEIRRVVTPVTRNVRSAGRLDLNLKSN